MTIIEKEFITSILEEKLSLDRIRDSSFQTRWLSDEYAEIYEFLDNYFNTNTSLPSIDLVETRFPIFSRVIIKNDPVEILLAIKKNKETDILYDDIRQSLELLKISQNANKVKNFLQEKLDKLNFEEECNVYDFSSDKFKVGIEDYERRRKAYVENSHYGIPAGFGKEFDDFINGGLQIGLYGVVGVTGVSKTWIMEVINNSALLNKKTPLMVGLESNVYREYYRALTISQGISNIDIQRGKIDLNDFKLAEEHFRRISKENGSKYYLEVMGRREQYTVADFRRSLRKYKPDLAVIDYLTLMSAGDGSDDWKSYLNISKGLAIAAAGFKIPIICVLQGTLGSSKDSMDLADIAVSKGMARDFDFLFGVTKVKGKENTVRINDIKQRDGNSQFDAYYRTGWNTGKIKFEDYVTDGNMEF